MCLSIHPDKEQSMGLFLALCFIVCMCVLLTVMQRSCHYKLILGLITSFYTASVLYFTLIYGGRNELVRVSLKPPMYFIKAILSGKYRAVTNRSVLNMLLFVPCGYLTPQWMRVRKTNEGWQKTVLIGFMASLLIETSQLVFHRGAFELDDLVKNTIGSAVGWTIWMILDKKIINRQNDEELLNADK